MWEYSDRVKEHFLHPRNIGQIENADAVGEVGSIICGDALKLYLSIDRDTGMIVDARFQTFGCASAIASSSALTELIKGKTLDEALKITNQDIAEFLGGLPREKMHCSVLGKEALDAAIANYRGQRVVAAEGGRLVCKCFDVTEEKIRRVALENNLKTIDEVTSYTKAGGGCGECRGEIEAILSEMWLLKTPEKPVISKRLTNLQRIALIQTIIENEIRPALQADGGDIDLIDIDANRVMIALRGMCAGCQIAALTLKGIQKKLKELVDDEIIVEGR